MSTAESKEKRKSRAARVEALRVVYRKYGAKQSDGTYTFLVTAVHNWELILRLLQRRWGWGSAVDLGGKVSLRGLWLRRNDRQAAY
jgi:hypothetical protein